MNNFSLIVQSLVALGYLVRASGHLFNVAPLQAWLEALRPGRRMRWGLGGLELLGGLAMLAAVAQPFLVFFVSVFLTVLALSTLLLPALRPTKKGSVVVAVLLTGTLIAAALQPLGLQVLALPKADSLPMQPVPQARTLKTYDEGLWFESVRVGPDGTIYLAGNQGENYATGDKSQAQAQVIARAPDGGERVFFKLPKGATAGVIAFDAQGRMFMTGHGAALGVWRFTSDGKGELFARLPKGAWPNGMTAGPDGQLYVADSLLGRIWRVDPNSGKVSVAIDNAKLRRRPFIALAPGANGIHFFGRDLFVTVSDSAQVLRFKQKDDGDFDSPVVFATGIPGDDFAIDAEGSLYITTHPFNTIVKVTQGGQRTIVANETHGVIGATDAAFGVNPGDTDTLYVATDGGAFSGDTKARGALLALKVRP